MMDAIGQGFGGLQQLAQQTLEAWTRMARGEPAAGAQGSGPEALWQAAARAGGFGAEDVVDRLGAQARSYFSGLQALLGAGTASQTDPAAIAKAWRDAFGGAAANPMQELLRGLGGAGSAGIDQLARQAMAAGSGELQALLALPAFGLNREHQQRRQALAAAQLRLGEALARYNGLMARVSERALDRFESLLAARSEPGRQLESARALFDLWVDAAEDAWADTALSSEFRTVYGELSNALMQVRKGVVEAVEQACRELGMPVRSEMDGALRKLHALQREVRQLRAQLQAMQSPAADTAPAGPAPAAAPKRSAPTVSAKTSRAADAVPAATPAPVEAPARPRKAAARPARGAAPVKLATVQPPQRPGAPAPAKRTTRKP